MKPILCFLCLIFLLGCSGLPQTERSVDLGSGYDAAIIAEKSSSSFESIGHFQYLRHKKKKVCTLGHYDVSKDGKYIGYQEAITGKIFIIDKALHTNTEMTEVFPGLVRNFIWPAKGGVMVVEIYDKEPLTLGLPTQTNREK